MTRSDTWRARREARLAKADQVRPVRTPNLDGWAYKTYVWWYQQKHRTSHVPTRFDFCSFWRAVLFWAPGRYVRKKTQSIPFARILAGALALAVLAFIIWGYVKHTQAALVITGVVGGVVYLVLVLNLGGNMLMWITKKQKRWHVNRHADVALGWRIAYIVVCGLPATAIALVLGALLLIIEGVFYLTDEKGVHRKVGKAIATAAKSLDAHPKRLPWLRPWTALPVIALALFITYGTSSLWVRWAMAALLVVAFLYALVLAATLAINAWEESRERRDNEFKVMLFSTPGFTEWFTADPASFENYDERWEFDRWKVNATSTPEDFARVFDIEDTILMLRAFHRARPLPESVRMNLPPRVLGVTPRRERFPKLRKAGRRVRWLFVGLGELLALIWSGFVYVKRVKACPMYDVQRAKP